MDFPKLFQSAKAPDFTTAIAAILVVLWIFFLRRQRKASSRLPPGPTPWPIVGNLFQLGRLPHLNLAHFANKYGPIFSLRLGSVPTIVVSSSTMAKVILKTQDSIFANPPKTAAGKYYAYDYKDVALTCYGAYWRQMKKLCLVEMFSAKRLESFTPILEEELTYALRFVWKESRCGERAVNLSEIVVAVIVAHVWRILSGMSSNEYRLNESGKQIKELILEVSQLTGSFSIGKFIPWLDWLDLGGVKRAMRRGQQSFDKVASNILEDHKERRTKSSSVLDKKKKEDVIDALLEMQANDSITMTHSLLTSTSVDSHLSYGSL